MVATFRQEQEDRDKLIAELILMIANGGLWAAFFVVDSSLERVRDPNASWSENDGDQYRQKENNHRNG